MSRDPRTIASQKHIEKAEELLAQVDTLQKSANGQIYNIEEAEAYRFTVNKKIAVAHVHALLAQVT